MGKKKRGLLGRMVDRVLLGPESGRDGPNPDFPRGGEMWRYDKRKGGKP